MFATPKEQQSEDCLKLNIYKPAVNHTHQNQPLPVMVWFHGGSWQEGSANQARINATHLVMRSVELGRPIIYVAPNYRLGAFGFLSGEPVRIEQQKGGVATLNAGLWDQREALAWVQQNIRSFGGDPSRVTVFGESAGAINIGALLQARDGAGSEGLFQAAILQSGSAASGGRRPASHPSMQKVFDLVSAGAGCNTTADHNEQMDCLRSVSTDKLAMGNNLAIGNSYMAFTPVQDDYFFERLPSTAWEQDLFMPVPVIVGTNLDEGTEFPYPTTVIDDEGFIRAQKFALGSEIQAIMSRILQVWPMKPDSGAPYRPHLFNAASHETFFEPAGLNQFKRQASMFQDVFFEAGRRLQLRAARQRGVKAWAYRFAQPSPVGLGHHAGEVARASMGVQHGAEIPFVFAQPPLQGERTSKIPEPLRTFASDENLKQVSKVMTAAWLNFAYFHNPNGAGVPLWEQYDSQIDSKGNGAELHIQADNFAMTQDDAQHAQSVFVHQHRDLFYI
jgi:carboxylesterase type B